MPKASVDSAGPWRLPLSWVAMPFSAWLCLVGAVMVLIRLVQGGLDLNPKEKWGRFQAAGIWAVASVAGFGLYKWDPANKIQFFNGGISFTPGTAVALVLLVIAACVAMVAAGRATTSRGYSKTVVTQAALLAGSVVFGLPFVFLLITSFKEPLDMSSPTGIVWVPRVSQTVPYMDKADPQYATTYQGTPVVAHVVQRRNDGTALLDVLRPANMAGYSLDAKLSDLKEVPRDAAVVTGAYNGQPFQGIVIEEMQNGHKRVSFTSPASLANQQHVFQPSELTPVRKPGLNLSNYPESLEYLPREADGGLVYLKNTLTLVVFNVLGTLLSSTIVAYAFSRMKFPGRDVLFQILLSTLMLPAAVTLLPQFLIWRNLHAIDTLFPLFVGSFFGSAFNIFLLRQFFLQIPMELEDAAKIDGCSYLRTFRDIMVPQIKPALAVIAIGAFLAAWNDFMGPLIYINSPEHMTLSYALQQFQSDRFTDEPGLVMAFATMCMVPVLALFFFCQRYFIEGVTLSGLGGR
jgi:multiple sugar transport system permease protein